MLKVGYQTSEFNVAVVGSNSDIGHAVIQQLLKSGATVFGMDIQVAGRLDNSASFKYSKVNPLVQEELEIVAKEISANANALHAIINLSGTVAHFDSFENMTAEQWQLTYDISFKSTYNSCHAFLPLLKKAAQGAIVNMSSGLAFGGQKGYGPYTTAKAAVVALSRTLATELAPKIRVNSVAPGAVDTNFIYQEDGTTRFEKPIYQKITPLGQLAKAEEIASVLLFLLSDGASHITGQCLHINGGSMMV